MCCGGDAINEDKIVLCCALCCAHCGLYTSCDCPGCSGKVGLCTLSCEFCCKPGAPCLVPCGVCGLKCLECDGCSIVDAQIHAFCLVCTCAFPCNNEVPPALSILGVTLYPKCGVCMPIKTAMERE